jgi:hypothetical protein
MDNFLDEADSEAGINKNSANKSFNFRKFAVAEDLAALGVTDRQVGQLANLLSKRPGRGVPTPGQIRQNWFDAEKAFRTRLSQNPGARYVNNQLIQPQQLGTTTGPHRAPSTEIRTPQGPAGSPESRAINQSIAERVTGRTPVPEANIRTPQGPAGSPESRAINEMIARRRAIPPGPNPQPPGPNPQPPGPNPQPPGPNPQPPGPNPQPPGPNPQPPGPTPPGPTPPGPTPTTTSWWSRLRGLGGKIKGFGSSILKNLGWLVQMGFAIWYGIKGLVNLVYMINAGLRVTAEGQEIGVSFWSACIDMNEINGKFESLKSDPKGMGLLGYISWSMYYFWKNAVGVVINAVKASLPFLIPMLTVALGVGTGGIGFLVGSLLFVSSGYLVSWLESLLNTWLADPYKQTADAIKAYILEQYNGQSSAIQTLGEYADTVITQREQDAAAAAPVPTPAPAPNQTSTGGGGTGGGTRPPQAQPAPAATSRRDLRRQRRLQRLDERATRRESRGRGPGRRLEGRRSRLEGQLGLQPGERRASLRESLIKMANELDAQGLFEESDMLDNLLSDM